MCFYKRLDPRCNRVIHDFEWLWNLTFKALHNVFGKNMIFLLACTWGLKHDKSINHEMTSSNVWHFSEIRLSIFGVKKKKAVAFILTVFLAVFCYYRIITTTVLIVYFNWLRLGKLTWMEWQLYIMYELQVNLKGVS
jgi:hypothetical protein